MTTYKEKLEQLQEEDGMTLKGYQLINYKSGYQVADEGIEVTTIEEALKAIESYNGDCGIWLSNGIYYIDKSRRISGKKQALEYGRRFNQISIFDWKRMECVYC